jgi:hypothetical protein
MTSEHNAHLFMSLSVTRTPHASRHSKHGHRLLTQELVAALPGNDYFTRIDEEFIEDQFNLTGLKKVGLTISCLNPVQWPTALVDSQVVSDYQEALNVILDSEVCVRTFLLASSHSISLSTGQRRGLRSGCL